MRLKWILIVLSASILLPVLVLAIVLMYLHSADLGKHRDFIAEYASTFLGRTVSLDGEIDLDISMTPSVVISDIVLANASWASEHDMLTVQRVETEIELLSLLRGDIHIPRLHLKGVKALLETSTEGLGNWVFAGTDDTEIEQKADHQPADIRLPWLGDASITDVEFMYLDGQTGQRINAHLDHAQISAASPVSVTVVDISGHVNDHPVEINGKLAVPGRLTTGSIDIPVELHAALLDLQIDANGNVTGSAIRPAIKLNVHANAANLNQLRQLFGEVVPDVQPVKLVMDAEGDQGGPVTMTLNAIAGKAVLDTRLVLHRDAPRPKLSGSLDVSNVDVARLWAPLFAGGPGKTTTTKVQASPSTAAYDLNQPIPVAWLNMLDADVVISANNVNLPQANITSLHSRIVVDDRRLNIDKLKLSTGAGTVMAGLLLNTRGQQPDIQLDLNTTTVALAKLQPLAANKRLAHSNVEAALSLTALGGTVAELITNLHGRMQLEYDDQKREEQLKISLTRKPENESADKTRFVVAASGRIEGHPIEVDGTIIPPAGILSRNKPYEIDLAMHAFGVTGRVTGTATDPYTSDGFNLDIEAKAADLGGLRQAFGQSVPTIGKTNLSTRLTLQQSRLRLSKLQAALGDGRIDGWLELDTAASIPDLQAELAFSEFNLDKLLPAEDKAAVKKPATKAVDDKLFSDEALPFEALARANIKATLRARNMVRNNMRLNQAEIKIDLAKRKLNVSLLKLASVQGTLVGHFTVDASASGAPSVVIELKAPHIELGELLASAGRSAAVEGPLAADILLQGQGNSVAQIMATLDGKINLLAEHGSADAEALDLFVGGLSAMFGTIFTEQSSKTRINCAICDLELNNGLLTTRLAVLDTRYSTVFVDGQVNLKNEQLDLTVSPEAKGVTLSVAFPVILKGSLASPNIVVEKKGALLKTGELWATVAYPPAALLKFGDLGNGHNPCVSMVAEKGGLPIVDDLIKATEGAVKATEEGAVKATEGAVKATEGAVKGIGGVVKDAGSGLGKIFKSVPEDGESATASDDEVDEDDDFDMDF